MKMYIGVTDYDWFQLLKSEKCDEVNFWTPSARNFRALEPNDLFLFKLHKPYDCIVGGGYFIQYSILPTFLAWEAFGYKNGTHSLKELNDQIAKYKRKRTVSNDENDYKIGCIILTEPFFFDQGDWIPAPEDWSSNIVQGKTYSTETLVGQRIYYEVSQKLTSYKLPNKGPITNQISESENQYTYSETKHRIGQGAFRVLVTDAYQRRCAITGERTLPVLEAAHIKPYSENGKNIVSNGILLRSDFHTLYDQGYITIDKDLRVDVSRHLNEDYGNGKDYYKYHGKQLKVLPDDSWEMPSKEMLEWHNENVFLG